MNVSMTAQPPLPLAAGRPSSSYPRFTARDLLTALFYHKNLMLLAFLVPVVIGLAAASVSKTVFVAQARLLVLYGSEYVFRPAVGQPGGGLALDRNQIILGELQILQSTTLALETLQAIGPDRIYPNVKLGDQGALELAANRLLSDLTVGSIAQSNVIELSYRNVDRDIAAEVLRVIISRYLDRRLAIFAKTPSTNTDPGSAEFLGRLRAAEDALSTFSNSHGIGNLDQQIALLLHEQSDNQVARHQTQELISEATAKLASVQANRAHTPPTIQAYVESTKSQQSTVLTDNLLRLQVRRRELTARYQENFPTVEEVDRQITALQAQIAREPGREASIQREARNPVYQELVGQEISLQGQLAGLVARAQELVNTAASLDDRIREINNLSRQYRELLRNRDVLDDTYRVLTRNREETQIADEIERSRAANIRVVQPPERPAAGRSLRLVLAAGGVFVGIAAALAVFAVLSAMRQVFISVRDVDQTLGVPVLTAVPKVRAAMRLKAGLRRPSRWPAVPA